MNQQLSWYGFVRCIWRCCTPSFINQFQFQFQFLCWTISLCWPNNSNYQVVGILLKLEPDMKNKSIDDSLLAENSNRCGLFAACQISGNRIRDECTHVCSTPMRQFQESKKQKGCWPHCVVTSCSDKPQSQEACPKNCLLGIPIGRSWGNVGRPLRDGQMDD